MSIQQALELRDIIEESSVWPLPHEAKIHKMIREWEALYEADEEAQRVMAGWSSTRAYYVDPLPGKVADGIGNFIIGDDPIFTPGNDADAENLKGLVEENDLPGNLQDATSRLMIAQGEAWWRIRRMPGSSKYARVEWHSRLVVVPHFEGDVLVSCAFVSEVARDDQNTWRYVNIHSDEAELNLLYRASGKKGTSGTRGIGERRDLTERRDTEDLREEWIHGLPMLAGRFINRRGKDRKCGVSQFQRVRSLFLALNESTTIGVENAKKTLRQRMIVDERLATPGEADAPNANLPAYPGATYSRSAIGVVNDDDVLLHRGSETGDEAPVYKVLEYSFDANALVTYDGHLTDKILTRVGVAPQLVGRHTEQAQSGAALRARLLDTILDSIGKARVIDDGLPKVVTLAQRLDSMPEAKGGLGRSWRAPEELPTIERSSAIPDDETELAARHVSLVGAMIESAETALRDIYPNRDEKWYEEELARIAKAQSGGAAAQFGGGAPQTPPTPPAVNANGAGGAGRVTLFGDSGLSVTDTGETLAVSGLPGPG
jgi:hypothetical protein